MFTWGTNGWAAAVILGGATAIALIAFSILAGREQLPFWPGAPPDTLRVGAFAGDVGVLAWIAKDRGFYDQVGLNVDLRGYQTGRESVDALQAGQVDIATASEFVVATRSFAHPDLRILASLCQ